MSISNDDANLISSENPPISFVESNNNQNESSNDNPTMNLLVDTGGESVVKDDEMKNEYEVLEINISCNDHPVFKVLEGYSLYKLKEKQKAIHAFLNLSSTSAIFSTGNKDNLSMLNALCEGPKLALKRQKVGTKTYPVNWGKNFCAHFLTSFYILVQKENECKQSVDRKRSLRKQQLPTAANHLLTIVKDAISKVENDSRMSSPKKRRKKQQNLSAGSLLIKKRPECNNFIEVTAEIIEANLICPICKHKSIVALTKKEDAAVANDQIRINFERRMKEWEINGRVGGKPRIKKTQSQILGCMCYIQNCLGSTNGNGCFKCKSTNGEYPLVLDNK